MSFYGHDGSAPTQFPALRETIDAIAEGEDDVHRAVAAAIQEHAHETFTQRYGVECVSTGTTCLRRLHGEQCRRGYPQKSQPCEPHDIPHADHVDLWLRDGKPVLYTAHLYDLPHEYIRDIIDFCDEHELNATFDPGSYYFYGSTTLVAIRSTPREGTEGVDR